MMKKIDDTFELYERQQTEGKDTFKLDNIDFGRRMAVERDLHKACYPNSFYEVLCGVIWCCVVLDNLDFGCRMAVERDSHKV
jgi:hypothetical protein